MRNRFLVILGLVAITVLLGMMYLTTPSGIGPFGVLVFFTMFYVSMFVAFFLCARIVNVTVCARRMTLRRSYGYAAVLSFGAVMFLLINTFAVRWFFALAIVIAFSCLGCFFVRKKM